MLREDGSSYVLVNDHTLQSDGGGGSGGGSLSSPPGRPATSVRYCFANSTKSERDEVMRHVEFHTTVRRRLFISFLLLRQV